MVDATHCPACGHVNAFASETCENCGEPIAPADSPVHPGETFRDPDDLSFPEPPSKKGSTRSMLPAGAWIQAQAHAAADADDLTDAASEAEAIRELAARIARRRALAAAAPGVALGTRPAHHAGFVIRAVAFVIDAVVLGAFTVPLTIAGIYGVRAGLAASGTNLGFIDTEEALARLLGVAWLAMATIYFTAMHSETGQTIGKAIVGIAVRRARDLATIGAVRSFVRVLAYALSAAVFFLGFLTIIFSPRKRGWHDYLAGTCVVHLAPEEV